MSTLSSSADVYDDVHRRIVAVIEGARHSAARQVNATMTAAYWQVGQRIVAAEQGGASRATYGQALIAELSGDLTRRFGRGFSPANLASMRAFHLAWPLEEIFQTLSGKSADGVALDVHVLRERFPLPWSAYVRLLSVKRPEARDFYEREALREGWSVRQLDRQIGSQLYERLVLSKNKAALLDQAATAEASETMTPEEALRDPFVLEFLNLKDQYSESDLEEGLIQHLADFLLELGDDFAYVGRQRRLRIDDAWFRVDLLFFHRRLKCLIVIDLKVGRFSYADAGQMHMYLNYAREHWMKPGENPPVGLILCAEKGSAEARYALENLPNKVLAAEYQMVLPDTTLIAEELQRTQIELSRANRLRHVNAP
ncbi:PDDEXK nuclease domain-containing protein [Robbsia andropogonis]|nr:PDDEXK nuclease domain-containing protein [Robbsia andropogonis]